MAIFNSYVKFPEGTIWGGFQRESQLSWFNDVHSVACHQTKIQQIQHGQSYKKPLPLSNSASSASSANSALGFPSTRIQFDQRAAFQNQLISHIKSHEITFIIGWIPM